MSYSTVYLQIAELIVAETPVKVCTVLGSCVSVCLYSPERKAGGMIHFALPAGEQFQEDLRVGDRATPLLIRKMCEATGLPSSSFIGKVVGGAAVLEGLSQGVEIGKRNIEIAERILLEAGIKIAFRDVGGTKGRKIYFYSDSGRLDVLPVTS